MRRWTETTKWNDRWFRRLDPSSKIFYLYLLDNCDEAGVWERDFDRFAFESRLSPVGELGCDPGDMDERDLVESLGNRIQVLPDDKILVPKFLPYQQPKGLRENVPLHDKIKGRLDCHGLLYHQGKVTLKGDTGGGSGDPPPDPPGEGLVSVSVKVPLKKKEKKEEGVFPASLDREEFREAWKDFVAYRIEIKRKLTDLARTRTLNRLAKVDVAVAVAAIYRTIESSWTGVDPKFLERNGSRSSSKLADRDYDNCLEV